MLFPSYEFLYFFLPFTLALVYACNRQQWREAPVFLLFLASLFFYGWWNPKYVLLILASIAVNYRWALFLRRHPGRLTLGIGIGFNLGLLGYFKYADFFIDNINYFLADGLPSLNLVLPLAISFFTFQQIAYLVDVHKKEVIEHNFWHYCFFVTFFPQLIAGPIVHHREMMPQIAQRAGIHLRAENISIGLTLLIIGLAKKVLIADQFADYANPVFAAADAGQPVSGLEAWIGVLCYGFQLYFDFSGYADMALGLAKLFGIDLPLNFNSPYKARSMIEFWQRWHMTLSRFLRDYVYIPLGGNRKGRWRRHANLTLTMVVGGVWHGAGWNFFIWGLVHGAYLLINHGWLHLRDRLGLNGLATSRLWGIAGMLITFTAVFASFPLFRAETLPGAVLLMNAMIGGAGEVTPGAWLADGSLYRWIAIAWLILWLAPNSQALLGREEHRDGRITYGFRPRPWHAAVLLILLLQVLLQLTEVSEFLYYQF